MIKRTVTKTEEDLTNKDFKISEGFRYPRRYVVKGRSTKKPGNWVVEWTGARLDDPERFREFPEEELKKKIGTSFAKHAVDFRIKDGRPMF